MKSLLLVVVIVLVLAVNGSGMTYMGQPEYSAGTGANSAYITLDFDHNNAFVFEYHWNGNATAWDALQALDASGNMDMSYYDFGGSLGIWIYDFAYPAGAKFDYGMTANTGWAYYTGENNIDWQYSMVGATVRSLNNGSWDSWVWTNYPADWSMPIRQPGEMPIPEPMTLTLLAFGVVMAVRKKR